MKAVMFFLMVAAPVRPVAPPAPPAPVAVRSLQPGDCFVATSGRGYGYGSVQSDGRVVVFWEWDSGPAAMVYERQSDGRYAGRGVWIDTPWWFDGKDFQADCTIYHTLERLP